MARVIVVVLALLVTVGCGSKDAPVCEGGKRCDVGFVVHTCVKMKAYPQSCDVLEGAGLVLACHTPVMVEGEQQDIRDYCAKDPMYVPPVVSWSERFTQASAILVAIVIALFTGARARRIQGRKIQLGIRDSDSEQ